jgi:hypothetical protein
VIDFILLTPTLSAPTVGALGDAGAFAEKVGMRILNKKLIGIGITQVFQFSSSGRDSLCAQTGAEAQGKRM